MRSVDAEIRIPEQEIADVKVGQTVMLKARAYPQSRFQGQVSSIAPVASEEEKEPGAKTVRVWSRIDNPSLSLKSEMTGRAQIDTGKRRMIEVLTRRMIRYVRVEFWSWW